MENLIVYAIVAVALGFTVRHLYKLFRGEGGCCGTSCACNSTNPDSCSDSDKMSCPQLKK